MTKMRVTTHARRAALALSAAGLVGALGACDLSVVDPERITEPVLEDSTLANELANAPVGLFNITYANYAYASAVFSDEAVSGHNFEQWQDVDARVINDSDAGYGEYVRLHQIRFLGGNMATRLTGMLGEQRASTDNRVAMAYAMQGYGTLLLGEMYCESPLAGDQAASSSEQILQAAIPAFEKGLAIATAANNQQTVNIIRVGLARTYLNLGNTAKAAEFAAQVPANFVAYATSSGDRTELYTPYYSATVGQQFNIGVDTKFQNLNDPRIRHKAAAAGHNVNYPVSVPYMSPSFTGYNAATPTGFQNNTDLRYASGLEAQYIVAEAQGPNAVTVAFINSRRAIGNQTPLLDNVSAAEFRLAILDQRARDFYLDGHRVGDLRRFKKLYQVDQFPTGDNPNPGPKYTNYGTAECFVPTRGERIGNPNY